MAQIKDGATAKACEFNGFTHFFAHFIVLVDAAGFAQGYLLVGVDHFIVFHHFAITVDFAIALVGVYDNIEVFVGAKDFGDYITETFFQHAYQRGAVDVFCFFEFGKCVNQTDDASIFLSHCVDMFLLLFSI